MHGPLVWGGRQRGKCSCPLKFYSCIGDLLSKCSINLRFSWQTRVPSLSLFLPFNIKRCHIFFRNGHFSGFSRDLEVWLLFPFFALVLVHTVEKTSGDSFLRRNSGPFWCAFWIRACNAVRSTNTSHPSSSCTVFFLEFCKSEDNINEQHVLKAISHNETIWNTCTRLRFALTMCFVTGCTCSPMSMLV